MKTEKWIRFVSRDMSASIGSSVNDEPLGTCFGIIIREGINEVLVKEDGKTRFIGKVTVPDAQDDVALCKKN